MNAEEFFEMQLSTDANKSIVDIYVHKYSRSDLLKFAEAYHEARMKEELIEFLCQIEESIFYSDRTASDIIDYYLATRKSQTNKK